MRIPNLGQWAYYLKKIFKCTIIPIFFCTHWNPSFKPQPLKNESTVARGSHFGQAPRVPPTSRLGLAPRRSRPAPLTDSCGRGHRCQRHGGVFVRVCGTGCGGQWLIEAPHQIIVPWCRGSECAARRGAGAASGAGKGGARRRAAAPSGACSDGGSVWMGSSLIVPLSLVS